MIEQEDRIPCPAIRLIYPRGRLLATLHQFIEAQTRLTVISAPAGYGKSALLADFSAHTPWPVCWCAGHSR